MIQVWLALMLTVLLMTTGVTPAAGQFWQATPKELKYHAQLAPLERELIYSAVLADADSLVRAVWGTPDNEDELKGKPPEGRPLTLVLDPRIWAGSLLTGPPVAGRHDGQWITAMRDRGFIAGECLARNDQDSCDQASATMVIMTSSIAPGEHHTVTVLLTMTNHWGEGERSFFSEWFLRLKQEGKDWRITERRMGAIS